MSVRVESRPTVASKTLVCLSKLEIGVSESQRHTRLLSGVDRILRSNREHQKGAAVIGWNTTFDEHINNHIGYKDYDKKQFDDNKKNGRIESMVCLFAPLDYLNKELFSSMGMMNVSADQISVVKDMERSNKSWQEQGCKLRVELLTDVGWTPVDLRNVVSKKLVERVIAKNAEAVKIYGQCIDRAKPALLACGKPLGQTKLFSGILPRFLSAAESSKAKEVAALSMWKTFAHEFVATSTDVDVATSFGGWDGAHDSFLFELTVQEKSIGFDMVNDMDSDWYCYDNEKEVVLFPSNDYSLTHYCAHKDVDNFNFTMFLNVKKPVYRSLTRWDVTSLAHDPHWADGG